MAGRVRPLACLMVLMAGAAPTAASDATPVAPAIVLPDFIDLGAVPRGRAGSVTGRLELHAARREAGATLFLSCRDPRIELRAPQLAVRAGRSACNFRLDVGDVATGPQACALEATLERGDERIELGELPVRWRVYDPAVTVRNWLGPEPLHTASTSALARLAIRSTPDLAGKPLALQVRLEDLPQGMHVDIASPPATLRGDAQEVDVRLLLRGVRRGRFEGRLELVPPDGAQAPDPLPLVLEVAATAVTTRLIGEVGALEAEGERWLHVELAPSGLTEPAVVELQCDRAGLPEGIDVEVPSRVRLLPDRDSTLLPIRVRARGATAAGSWTPVLRVVPRTPGVVAVPAELPLPVRVTAPHLRGLAWAVLAGAGLLLAVLRIRGTLRRPVGVPRRA